MNNYSFVYTLIIIIFLLFVNKKAYEAIFIIKLLHMLYKLQKMLYNGA